MYTTQVKYDNYSGLVIPYLVLNSKLQFEPVPYALILEAVDGGLGWGAYSQLLTSTSFRRPQNPGATDPAAARLTGSTMILVSVDDANDNAPAFDDDTVKVRVREDHDVGGLPVYKLTAVDADRGANADVSYFLAPSSELVYGQYFVVNRSTGIITLK